MKIAIIGAGNLGGALGRAWSKNGHSIVFGVCDPAGADTGGLGMARSLEPLALLWIRLAVRRGRNPNFVWGMMKR